MPPLVVLVSCCYLKRVTVEYHCDSGLKVLNVDCPHTGILIHLLEERCIPLECYRIDLGVL